MKKKKKIKIFSEKPVWLIFATATLLVIVISLLKYYAKEEMSLSVFYIIPVVLVTWYINKPFGWWVISFISTFSWLLAEIYIKTYSAAWLFLWNSATRLIFFIAVAYLLESLKKALQREKESARIDALTEIPNSRMFYEIAEQELHRFRRQRSPITVAYIDLDNFKTVNDNFGHLVGDMLLKEVAGAIKNELRTTDIVARLGGDEFAILFPDTDRDESHTAIRRIRNVLLALMKENNWLVTFSIGVVTFREPPDTVAEMVTAADYNMYMVKNADKNDVKHIIYNNQKSLANLNE